MSNCGELGLFLSNPAPWPSIGCVPVILCKGGVAEVLPRFCRRSGRTRSFALSLPPPSNLFHPTESRPPSPISSCQNHYLFLQPRWKDRPCANSAGSSPRTDLAIKFTAEVLLTRHHRSCARPTAHSGTLWLLPRSAPPTLQRIFGGAPSPHQLSALPRPAAISSPTAITADSPLPHTRSAATLQIRLFRIARSTTTPRLSLFGAAVEAIHASYHVSALGRVGFASVANLCHRQTSVASMVEGICRVDCGGAPMKGWRLCRARKKVKIKGICRVNRRRNKRKSKGKTVSRRKKRRVEELQRGLGHVS